MQTTTETTNGRKAESENKQLRKIIEDLVKSILVTILVLAISLFVILPQQKEANILHHAKQLSLIVIRQFTRFFPGQYAESDKWRERANEYVRFWNEVMNGVSGHNRRQGDDQ